jgi:hypothetical protein
MTENHNQNGKQFHQVQICLPFLFHNAALISSNERCYYIEVESQGEQHRK